MLTLTRTLALVSPHMSGDDVRDLQAALARRGVYHGKIDGDYGPVTATAVRDAQFRLLGYLKRRCTGHAGPAFARLLSGADKLTVAQQARVKLRAAKMPAEPEGVRAVRRGLTHVGEKESPAGSNRVVFSIEYGIIGAWCAMFVSMLLVWIGSKWAKRGARWHYCPTMEYEARHGLNGLRAIARDLRLVLTGDVVLFDWQRTATSAADHVGLAITDAWLRENAQGLRLEAIKRFGLLGPGDLWVLEGNTSVGNDSDGGEVLIRRRNLADVRLIARLAT